MKDLLVRLSSRTFWVTIGSFITLVAAEQYTEAVAVAIAYITGEKYVDAKRPGSRTHAAPVGDESDVDNSRIVTGVGTIRPSDSVEE